MDINKNERLDMASPDLVSQNIEKLAALFPNCVTETATGKAIDFDLLKQELAYQVVDGSKERYRLEWPGKKEAIVTANLPTSKTLRPVLKDSIDFDNTQNIYIEGDNLEVLKLLQESYIGEIKLIYIDPPYNTGNDFVYNDTFIQESGDFKEATGQIDDYNQRLVANPETSGRYHSDWLSMMYPRIKLARNLLKEDGVIMISIDDNEVNNLVKICDEIFGEVNNAGTIVWQKSKKGDAKLIAKTHEYIVVYVKNKQEVIAKGSWKIRKEGVDEVLGQYEKIRKSFGDDHERIADKMAEWYKNLKETDPRKNHKHYRCSDDRGLYFPDNFAGPDDGRESRPRYDIIHPITGKSCKKPSTGWRWDEKKTMDALKQNPPLIHFGEDETTIPCRKSYLKQTANEPYSSVFYRDGRAGTLQLENLVGKGVFPFPKDVDIISGLIDLVTDDNAIVLDFFSGSAATAQAVLEVNAKNNSTRKFIMVQLAEKYEDKSEGYKKGYRTIADVGRKRITAAGENISKNTSAIDTGFRTYRLDASNMLDVYYAPKDYSQASLDMFANNIKPDRSEEDLLVQVMLDWGLPLSLKIERKEIYGKELFAVAGDSLYACFANGIDEEFAKVVAADAPLRIVFRDAGFKNDTAKTNVNQLLKQLSPKTVMKVI